jgi:hypothetical protein
VPETMTSGALEQLVFIIRHGEKPEGLARGINYMGRDFETSLTPRGWERAGALVGLFAPDGQPRAGYARPDALVSPGYWPPDLNGSVDRRTFQTIQPLSELIGISPLLAFRETEGEQLVEWVRTTAAKVVLICWEHSHIPRLGKLLAPEATIPSRWPPDRFDVVWRFPRERSRYGFEQLPELLLHDDKEETIPPSS